jgi:hypothetical protein
MYGDWLHGLNTRAKSLIMVGVAMLCWALWLSRNDTVFEKYSSKTYMQVFYRGRTGAGSGRSCRGVTRTKKSLLD